MVLVWALAPEPEPVLRRERGWAREVGRLAAMQQAVAQGRTLAETMELGRAPERAGSKRPVGVLERAVLLLC